jgi:iron complex outermembrane recepter protein
VGESQVSKRQWQAVAYVLGLLSAAAVPVGAEAPQGGMSEEARAARIDALQRERTKVEGELRQLRLQPEGTARSTVPRSEFSDQPTRSMKESLESLPGMSARQGANGRDVPLSIRGSK